MSKLETLFERAVFSLQSGYFEGVHHYVREMEKFGKTGRDMSFHVGWLASLYSGTSLYREPTRLKRAAKLFSTLTGGQGMAEFAFATLSVSDAKMHSKKLDRLLEVAMKQNGVLVTWHPTALLRLSELAIDKLGERQTAIRLVNCALGFRPVFMVLDDVERCGQLLTKLDAPLALWADWSGIFIRHIQFSTHRARLFAEEFGDEQAVVWAMRQDADSEHVLRRVLALAPRQLLDILCDLAPQLGLPGFPSVLRARIVQREGAVATTIPDSLWTAPDVLRLRYFWFDMLSENEQHILRNGDWAMFGSPTPDYSMAVAQWWRVLESTLKRLVAGPLSALYAKNPAWLEWDQKNLSARAKKQAAIFMEKLADPSKSEKLTLADLVLILLKCFPAVDSSAAESPAGSRLRTEAIKSLGRYRENFEPLVLDQTFSSVILTIENINLFRNRSSHDATVHLMEAATGRFVAKRLLDALFGPDLDKIGFRATIVAH